MSTSPDRGLGGVFTAMAHGLMSCGRYCGEYSKMVPITLAHLRGSRQCPEHNFSSLVEVHSNDANARPPCRPAFVGVY